MFNKKLFLLSCTLICFVPMTAQIEMTGLNISESGIKYKIHTQNTGRTAGPGDMIEMHLVNSNFKGEEIFSTYEVIGQPVFYQIEAPTSSGDIMEGLMKMKAGDSATFFIMSDSIYQDNIPPFTEAGEYIRFDVKIYQLLSKNDYDQFKARKREIQINQDKSDIEAYFQENKITGYFQTPEGIFIEWHSKGEGELANKGTEATAHYAGRLFHNNVEFDNSFQRGVPFTFPVGKGRVISGWDVSFPYLRQGDIVTIYIPSSLAYGENGSGGTIPSNAILIFDIEVIEVVNQ